MVTVKLKPPRSAEVLRKNPLGLYVDAIDWSRELETPVPSADEGLGDRQPVVVVPPLAAAASPADVPRGSPLDSGLAAPPAPAPSEERNAQ